MRKAYGFRTAKAIEIALYHQLGNLPEPEFTHEFRRGGAKAEGFAPDGFGPLADRVG